MLCAPISSPSPKPSGPRRRVRHRLAALCSAACPRNLMAARGYIPPAFEGRSIQAPGMMRHGPFPGLGSAGHFPVEHVPPVEFLENKVAVQADEMDRIATENHRLAETHVVLRQQLGSTQKEMQIIHADVRSILTESEFQVRGLREKIGKMESDILAGDMLRQELQQAHSEAQSLIAARQELTSEIQHVTEELQKASTDIQTFPEMHAELQALRQEHQKLRGEFEYEKGVNMDQVERMQAMDKNLMSLAKEVEKLRADVANAEKRTSTTPNPYGGQYGSPNPVYPPAGQGGSSYTDGGYVQGGPASYGHVSGYSDHSYGHAGAYTDGGYVQGGPASYSGAYGRSQAQMTSGATPEAMPSYVGASSTGYPDGYARAQGQMAGGAGAGEQMNPYSASGVAPYDAARVPPTSARR